MTHQDRTTRPVNRMLSLLLAMVLLLSTMMTASADSNFFISGVALDSANGNVYLQVTDMSGKLNGSTVTIDGVAAPATVAKNAVGTTYWFVIDVSSYAAKSSGSTDYVETGIKAVLSSLLSLPNPNTDDVRFVWVTNSVEVSGSMTAGNASKQSDIEVETHYGAYGKGDKGKDDADLLGGVYKAVEEASKDSSRFHRVFVITDGVGASAMNSVTNLIANNYPIPVYAVLFTNTYSSSTTSRFTSGHSAMKSFAASTNGLTYSVDYYQGTVKEYSLSAQASAACDTFQEHIDNSVVLQVNLTSIYTSLPTKASDHKSAIAVTNGSAKAEADCKLKLNTVPTPTPSPTPKATTPRSTTPKITNSPTPSPTPTPKPQFIDLAFGDKDSGNDTFVSEMQQKLLSLGYLTGDSGFTPGVYDTSTANALVDFAAQNGINLPDERGLKVDTFTLGFLFQSNRMKTTPTPEPTATPTPTPTAVPEMIDLEYGYEDDPNYPFVFNVQERLKALGFVENPANMTPGVYDDETAASVRRFCEENGVPVVENGYKVSVFTQRTLFSSNAMPHATPTPEPTATPTPKPTAVPDMIDLEYGYEDDPNYPFVFNMQERLKELGFVEDPASMTPGVYDDETAASLRRFGAENGVPVEDNGYKVSVFTQRTLFSTNAMAHATPTPEPTATPTPAPTEAPAYISLKLGDKDQGDAHYVANMQSRLNKLGFLTSGYNPGEYDKATADALNAYCEVSGMTGVDTLNPSDSLLRLLDMSDVTPTPKPTATPSPTPEPTPTPVPEVMRLEYGYQDSGDNLHVFNMQNRLSELGYIPEGAILTPGLYDDVTAEAVLQFCLENNMAADENGYVAPVSMIRKLMSNSARPHTTPTPEPTATPTPSPTPVPQFLDAAMGDVDAEGTDYITRMQGRLNDLGYYGENTFEPGVYGQSTADALLLFCTQNGYQMSADGSTVSASFLQNFLFVENAPAYVPVEPPLSEKILSALTSDITLFNITMPMWIIVAVCAVLLLVIIVLIIVVVHRSKARHSDSLTGGTGHTPASAQRSSADLSNAGDGMTTAGGDDEMTVADGGDSGFGGGYGGLSVLLDVTYNGRTVLNSRFNIQDSLTIGRGKTAAGFDCDVKTDPSDKSVSRHHCTLINEDGRLKLRNVSSQSAGTILNGMTISGAGAASEDAMTVADDSATGEEYVNSGDVIQIGRHSITVTI